VVELAIRDLKEGAGMEHVPSGHFSANSAWLQCAVLAHNLIRWTATLGHVGPIEHTTVARTVRIRLIAMPARLVDLAGKPTLRGPRAWPSADWFGRRLEILRACSPRRADRRTAARCPADEDRAPTTRSHQPLRWTIAPKDGALRSVADRLTSRRATGQPAEVRRFFGGLRPPPSYRT